MGDYPDLELLQERLGWKFKNQELLVQALTHKSWSNEHPGYPLDNERLEFLGDAVLDLVVGHMLYSTSDDLSEGDLTRIRAELVNEKSLASMARDLDIGRALRLGRGERLGKGHEKESLLANAFEAMTGALFLDSGYEVAADILGDLVSRRLQEALGDRRGQDYKSRLQEYLQGHFGSTPTYREVSVDGPAHARRYVVALEFRDEILAEGAGRSKKEAEQSAARKALDRFDE